MAAALDINDAAAQSTKGTLLLGWAQPHLRLDRRRSKVALRAHGLKEDWNMGVLLLRFHTAD